MTDLLAKLFVKDYRNVKNPAVRGAYGTMVSIVGIVCNLFLFTAKFLVGTLTGSLSIRADAVNNLSDAGSSLISLVSFRISMKKPDRDHPFGHARIEYIASMIVSFLILLVGFELGKESVTNLLQPMALEVSVGAIVVLSLSILVKLWLAVFNRRTGKKVDSSVMMATSADSLSDALSTGAVLISTIVVLIFPNLSVNIDAIMGCIVSCLILKAGIGILNETKNSLLGEAPPDEVIAIIKETVAKHPEILGIHDLVVHNYGPNHFMVAFHAEVDGDKNVFLSHEVIDNVEEELRNVYQMEATIHLDPIAVNDSRVKEIRTSLSEKLLTLGDQVKVHDVRLVPGEGHSNVIFDVCIPYECKMPEQEIREKVTAMVKEINPSYEAVFKIDPI